MESFDAAVELLSTTHLPERDCILLLKSVGSLQNLARASLQEIMDLSPLDSRSANYLYDWLHKDQLLQ